MKSQRQAKLLEIISQYAVDTQEELMRRLREAGFQVTQATVSRDIKELRLVKTPTAQGAYRYTVAGEEARDVSAKLRSLLADAALSVQCAANLTIMRTSPGMAQAICAAIDNMHWPSVIGTLAGEDTIFLAMGSEDAARQMAAQLNQMMG